MATMPAVASAFDMLLATFFYFFCGSEDGGAVMATTPPCLGEFEFFFDGNGQDGRVDWG